MDRIPERFPKLRIGFLEISAEWLPYTYTDLAKRFRIKGKELKSDFLRQDRIYVACETTDDIPYIVNKLGDDNIVIGSDYAHADSATELLAIHNLSADPRLTPSLAKKIVSDNARALYVFNCRRPFDQADISHNDRDLEDFPSLQEITSRTDYEKINLVRFSRP